MKISELYEKQADVFFDLIMQSDQQWRNRKESCCAIKSAI